jgi:hypothetical protein
MRAKAAGPEVLVTRGLRPVSQPKSGPLLGSDRQMPQDERVAPACAGGGFHDDALAQQQTGRRWTVRL